MSKRIYRDQTKEAFLSRVARGTTAECWPWTGPVDRDGYGVIGGGKRPERSAHRQAHYFLIGPIPSGMTVDHLCFNRACCNPAHLRLLTHAENARRQRVLTRTECANGHTFTPATTYITPRGHRGCRTCRNEAKDRWRASRAA